MAFKGYRLLLPLMILSLFIMACGLMQISKPGDISPASAPAGDSTQGTPDSSSQTQPSDSSVATLASSNSGASDPSPFPLPPDSKIMANTGGVVTARVKLSVDDVVAYYRKELPQQGLTEDKMFTQIATSTLNLEFKGSKNGKMLIIQGSDMGDGTVAFTIRYE
jgi:hypothetical protein